jgi:hypothetical protein
MRFQSILNEVEHLNGVSTRLEVLAEEHSAATEEILTIAGNVRNISTLLAVLVATKLNRGG